MIVDAILVSSPTGRPCEICDALTANDTIAPIIDTHNGKASSANNFPFHNWFNFVLGYSPQFPEYMLRRERIQATDVVLDPFMGTGTTLATCKEHQIPSKGIDANDFMVDAAKVKLNWSLDTHTLSHYRDEIIRRVEEVFHSYVWGEEQSVQLSLFTPHGSNGKQDVVAYVSPRRTKMLLQKYISDKPLARALMIDEVIKAFIPAGSMQDFFNLALTAIIVPISNVRYGPRFGMVKPRQDVPVLKLFAEKVDRMIRDLKQTNESQRATPTEIRLGDARRLSSYFDANSVAVMVTSPPYIPATTNIPNTRGLNSPFAGTPPP